jgi:hypothetical protein
LNTAFTNDPATATALAVAGVSTGTYTMTLAHRTIRYLRATPDQREVLAAARRIKRTWNRTARRVGLTHTEPVRSWEPGSPTRILLPAISVRHKEWRVVIDAHTVGRLGLDEFQKAADHLANAWRIPGIRIEQAEPGLIRIRAMVRDPLTTPATFTPTTDTDSAESSLTSWDLGIDSDGQPVRLRTKEVSGIVIAGLAGYGKTSLLNARFCQLAPARQVQIAVIDGKGGPDWDDLAPRAFRLIKDDPAQTRDLLAQTHQPMVDRQHLIRDHLGVKNIWHHGPSIYWPLVVIVIDEAHTYFHETKGTDPESRHRDQLARETTRLVEELVRKGRNVGIQIILATQKATADAIPTRIRDNCQIAISFAQRTSEAAIAALGNDITQHPDAHPRLLQDPKYVGVATVVAEGRPGFTLVRTPYVPDNTAHQTALEHSRLTHSPVAMLNNAIRDHDNGRGATYHDQLRDQIHARHHNTEATV